MILRFVLLTTVLVAAAPAADLPDVKFEKYALSNGLQVLLHVDRKLPIVHVNQWFHVGSKNEKKGRTGFAHLFEHMMFQGSKNAQEKYLAYAEKLGANLREGGVNGTTDSDRTNYFITAPSGALERLLWLESDRITGLLDAMTQEKLDNQRDVVKNERRQSLENQPYGRWLPLMQENLFPAGHPYSWPTIGYMDDLTAASMDDVKEFFRTYYTPNNLTLTIAGDFDPAEAKKLVHKYFASIPPGVALERPARLPASLDGEKIYDVYDRVAQARSFMGWITPAYFDPGDAELDLASTVLSDGLSSRLQKLLVYDKQVCTAVSAFNMSMEIAGAFIVMATARPGQSLQTIEAMISEELRRFGQSGPTPEELERAKNKHEFGFISGLERIGGFGGKADQLARYNTFLGEPGKFEEDLARYRSSTAEGLKSAVARYLDTRNRVVLRFYPERSARAETATLDRSRSPELQPDRPFSVPKVQETTLANGLRLFVVEQHELPKVAMQVVSRGGSSLEPPSKAPVAQLMIRTIDLGSPKMSALQIEDAFADMGTRVSKNIAREWATVGVEALASHVPRALELLSDVVLRPTFPPEEVERERKRLADDLMQEQQNPNRISRRVGGIVAFGIGHPYGHPALGTAEQLAALTLEDVKSFHADHFRPDASALIFTGDITLEQASKLAQSAFGAWTGAASQRPPVPAPQPSPAGRIYLVDRQDAPQTVVDVMVPGARRDTPDYYGMVLADAVYGGAFGTRLNLNLREQKGYSYGVFSQFWTGRHAGNWVASGAVQTKVTSESIAEFMKELRGLAGERPITAKELDEAKANKIRGYAQGFETLEGIASEIAVLYGLDRPMSDLADYPARLEKLTLEQVNALAKKYADLSNVRIVVVGDADKIAPGLRTLGAGEIVQLTPLGTSDPLSK